MSRLYIPHKGLGLYSSKVPLLRKQCENGDYYLFSAVGNYFMVYRFSDFAVIGISDRLTETIISMANSDNVIFCGCESKVFAFKRGKHVFQKFSYEDKKNWKLLIVIDDKSFLCGVSDSNFLVIWHIESGNVVYTCQFPEYEFDVCQVMQPNNYTNKILVASKQGQMHLMNYVNETTLYIFTLEKKIKVLIQAPSDDTIAIGCLDGTVLLHNLLYDKTLMSVKHDLGAISSIAFREDLANELIMLTGSESGHVTMWSLEKGRNMGQTRDCHQGAVASMFCVPGKPLLITNSGDNSIKIWNYDRPDGTPILHKCRSGHWLPPSYIDFWPSGPFSTEIVSGGHDSVINVFSTFEEKDNFSLGRAYEPHHGKREDRLTREQYVLPCPRSMSCSTVRDGRWDSVAVCHEGRRQVTTWSFSKRSRGQYYLDYSGFKAKEYLYRSVTATGCAMSVCGNFVVVAYSSGHVVKYNMQSGQERGEYCDAGESRSLESVAALKVGLSGSRMVVVTATVTGTVAMYDLVTRHVIATVSLGPVRARLMSLHPNKDMVAVATEDGALFLVQLTDLVVFQRLQASQNGTAINDVAFFHNTEKMVVADGRTVKTFDYIHQRLVDVFSVSKAVTRVAVAPNDALIATSHEDELGIYLWALKTQCYDMKLRALTVNARQSIKEMQLPQVTVVPPCLDAEESVDLDEAATVQTDKKRSKKVSQADRLATYTALPTSYLSGIVNVDQIRVRSEMAVRGVAADSFFLPQIVETLDGVKWKDESNTAVKLFDLSHKKKRPYDATKTSDIVPLADLHRLMAKAVTDTDFDECMTLLAKLTAANVDYEIQMLHPMYHGGSASCVHTFLTMITNQLTRRRSVDLCEMYVATFIKHNRDCVLPDDGDTQRGQEREEEEQDQLRAAVMDTADHCVEDPSRADRRQTLSLLNATVAVMRAVDRDLNDQLVLIQQMAALAGVK